MVELSYWNNVIVPQRHRTGCIQTGYEWIIRYLGIQGVQLDTFQEDFDLERSHEGSNNFVSVANRVRSKYPHLDIHIQSFSQGIEKIRAMKRLLERDIPCLMSLALAEVERTQEGPRIIHRGWHIMPVIYIDDEKMKVIHSADQNGNQIWQLPVAEVVWRHDNLIGGKDIAWFE
jgi:hypothetical protein